MLEQTGRKKLDIFNALSGMIGQTPCLKLNLRHQGRNITVYAKAEMYNFSGSIKDRMALSILRRATMEGRLKPGQVIAEATSGNAGIAIAALGRALGHDVTIFMPDWMSQERCAILRGAGADLRLVSKAGGGFLGAIAQAEKMGAEEGAFLPQQFANHDNCMAHYEGTGPEIWAQIAADGGQLGGFVAGVGTGGTVMGAGAFFKEQNADIAVHPVEPCESPTMSTGHKVGAHRIQGVSDEFIPDIVKLDEMDDIIAVHDGDAILMAQKLCSETGLGVGISSGGNLIAAIKAAMMRDDGTAMATVFADNNMKYLSTDLSRTEPVKDHYLTPQTEILSVTALRCPLS